MKDAKTYAKEWRDKNKEHIAQYEASRHNKKIAYMKIYNHMRLSDPVFKAKQYAKNKAWHLANRERINQLNRERYVKVQTKRTLYLLSIPVESISGLNARDHKIVMLKRDGYSTQQIADTLNLKYNSVSAYLYSAIRYLKSKGVKP